MDIQKIEQYKKLLGRELSHEEKERLQRIKNTLNFADNDALWDVLIAIEFQRTFYENIPKEIERKTQEIFENISVATEKEIQLTQGRLTKKVFAHTETLTLQKHGVFLVTWGIITLVVLLIYSSTLMLAGYCMALKAIQPWSFLAMPVGIIIGCLCMLVGVILGILSAKIYAEGRKPWYKYLTGSSIAFIMGAILLSLTLLIG